jgi:hypothetical protein
MPIISNYKLTFDPGGTPRVLLDFGDKVDRELDFNFQRNVEEIQIPEAAEPLLRLEGRRARRIEFVTWDDHASDRVARVRVMESIGQIDALEKKPLRIEVADQTDRYWQFNNAAVVTHVPRRLLECPTARREQRFVILATHWQQVGP